MSENNIFEIKTIAHVRTDFPEKFGIPRQSGLVKDARGKVIFLPEFRHPDAIKGIEEYDRLW
ncbi:MAG: TrmO family methyltransferase, partial [Lachnospiraceae bacterium]|nr:TrmO family methyltransferase [Lachnospiraceae bacterium]